MIQRVGVIGGGQLAWMMADAAQKLGVELIVQTPSADDPAVAIAAQTIFAPVDDAIATAQLAAQCDVITFENEFVNLEALARLNPGVCFRPSLETLRPLLDKYDQRCYLQAIGLPVPPFQKFDPQADPAQFPIVLKTRRHGYDGQGTFIIQTTAQLEAALETLGDRRLLQEAFVPFERELAVIVARSLDGNVTVFPIVETQQEQQVCRRVFAPAQVSETVQHQATVIARTLMNRLNAIGVFGIELFLAADDTILVNEIAPRTHNSGHLTLDACTVSQFEQQLRAVCGLPLTEAQLRLPGAVMVNLLGFETSHSDYLDKRQQLAALPQTIVHWYGKPEVRPGRKLGHVTALAEVADQATIAAQIEAIWYGDRAIG